MPFLDSTLTRLRSCSAPTPHHSTAVNCDRMQMHLTSWLLPGGIKAVRRLWQLPYTTHCNILPCLMGGLSAAVIIFFGTANFVMHNLRDVNDVLRGIAQSVSNCMYSHTCCTLAFLRCVFLANMLVSCLVCYSLHMIGRMVACYTSYAYSALWQDQP